MRYILAETIGTRRIQRRFYIGDTTLLLGVTSGTTILAKAYPDSAVEDWVVVSYNGEKVKFVKPLLVASGDTGLNDGDQGRDEIDA